MNMDRKITTLIPTHRRPEYLRRTILSALSQTYSNLQVSIFDDASNDNTMENYTHRQIQRYDVSVIILLHRT